PLTVLRQAPPCAGRGDAMAPADRPSVQRSCCTAHDTRLALRDAIPGVPGMADQRGALWRGATDCRDLHRSDVLVSPWRFSSTASNHAAPSNMLTQLLIPDGTAAASSADLLGERDEDALRATDITEPIAVLVLD